MESYPWWTETQKKLAQEAREVVDELMPKAMEYAWKREYPWEVVKEFGRRGWYGALIPKQYGGKFEDWGITGACILAEESGRLASPSNALINTMCNGGTHQIARAGNDEQKQRWLPGIARGDSQCCITITEPYAGSETAAIETYAVCKENVYVVRGKKRFITNSGSGDIYMVYAKTSDRPEDRAKYKHLTAFIIEKGSKGFHVEKQNDLIGFDGMYNGVLNFDTVEVPVANRLGEEGAGWEIMTSGLNAERTVVAAVTLGRMREALRWAVYHMERRIQFGQPTISIGVNQFKVADMIVKLSTARLFNYYTAYLCDLGVETPVQAAITKLFNTESFMRNFILDAIQCMGGDGLTRIYPLERQMRDAKMYEIGAGTSEVLRLITFRQGLRSMAEDLKVPRRVMNEELDVPLPAEKGDKLPVYKADETSILEALAENYRVNPGLYLTLPELKEQTTGSEEELLKSLNTLENQKLATLYRDRKGAISLVRATYDGLAKAKPFDYYRHIPPWVRKEDMF